MAQAWAPSSFTLDNGLVVVVLPRHDLPLVAVHLAYRCGSADEPAGRFGLAHLYEHLMYSGSPALPGLYLVRLLEAGATDLNGRTTRDSTHYFETIPTAALDFALRAEADRMGHLLEAVDEARLALQVSVVGNELRQRRAQPEASLETRIAALCFPAPHPYAHDAGGVEEQVQGVTLDDLRAWAQARYRPDNAVLVLVGDCTVDEARLRVQASFGGLRGAAPKGSPPMPMPVPPGTGPAPGAAPPVSCTASWHGFWRLPGDARTAAIIDTLLPELSTTLEAQAWRHGLAGARLSWQPGRLGGLLGLRARISGAAQAQQLRERLPALWREWLAPWAAEPAWAGSLAARRAEWSERLESRQAQAEALAAAVLDGTPLDLALDRAALVERMPLEQRLPALLEHLAAAPCEWLEAVDGPPAGWPTGGSTSGSASAVRQPVEPVVQTLRRTPVVALRAPDPGPWLPQLRTARLPRDMELHWACLGRRAPAGEPASMRLLGPGLPATADLGGQRAWADLALMLWRTAGAGSALERWSREQGLALRAEALDQGLRWSVSGKAETLRAWMDQAFTALAQPLPDAVFQDAAQLLREQLARRTRDRAPDRLSEQALLTLAQGLLPQAQASTEADAVETLRQCWAAQATGGLVLGLSEAERPPKAWAPLLPDPSVDRSPRTASEAGPTSAEGCFLIDRDGDQGFLSLAWPLPAELEAGRWRSAFQVLDALLAGTFSSRLNLRLREELGWSYGLRSRRLGPAGRRFYVIQTSVAMRHLAATQTEILTAVQDCCDAIETQRILRARRMLELSALGRLERRSAVLERLEQAWRGGDSNPFAAERERWWGGRDRQASIDCAQRLFAAPPRVLVVGPAAAIRSSPVLAGAPPWQALVL